MNFGPGHKIRVYRYHGGALHVCLRCGAYASKRGHKLKRKCEVPMVGTPKAQKRRTILQRIEAGRHPEENVVIKWEKEELSET